MSRELPGAFKDPTQLVRWATWLLVADVFVSFVAWISDRLEHDVLTQLRDGAFVTEAAIMAAADASDDRQMMVGIVQLLLMLVLGVTVLRWIHRANHNARQLGATDLSFTPGWAVGWYFVPIANLWKPYQAMKEIWQASISPADWRGRSVSGLLPTWWAAWLLSSAFGNASFRLSMRAEEIDELLRANVVTQISDLVDIPSAILVLLVIRRIHALQMARASSEG